MRKYADLTLYFGLCSCGGMGEFRFRETYSDKWLADAMAHSKARAAQIAANVVDAAYRGDIWPQLTYSSSSSLVGSETDARKVIDFMKGAMPGCDDQIDPYEIAHGQLSFERKLIIDGADRSKRQEIINNLRNSGARFIVRSFYESMGIKDAEPEWDSFLKFKKE